jgi:cytochrome c biogenesis protein CcmG/thiol:disulfide interchange protein DsbE
MIHRGILLGGTFALAVLLLGSAALAQGKAPNFSLKTSDGKSLELAKLQGKVVVVNFWATWCGPCRKEIPGFIEVYGRLKSKGLEIVGISLDREGWTVVKPYIDKSKITYPVVVDNGKLADAYGGIDAIPTTFIVDRKGNIVKKHVGYISKEDLEKLVSASL